MSEHLLENIKSNNIASIHDEATLALRTITEKRAATIAYMLDEARNLGLDETYARKAIAHYGADNGHKMAAGMQDPTDLVEFAAVFASGLEANVYEMETVSATKDNFIVHFHYCPYVNKWLEQKRTATEIYKLCNVCLEGDDAITQGFEGVKFYPLKTIARGDKHCEMCYRK